MTPIILLIVGLVPISAESLIDPIIKEQIDNYISSPMRARNIPGLALAILKEGGDADDNIIYTTGFGYANVEQQLTPDENSIFAIGSVTKSFTATIVVQELAKMWPNLGALVLDTPIRILAPGYNLTFIDKYRSESVTFKDLLSHRVCTLPDSSGIWVKAFENTSEMLYRQRYAPEQCSFRNGMTYNNALITLAGDIISFLKDTTFEILLQEFLDNLGMTRTTWVKLDDNPSTMPNRTIPYIWKGGGFVRYNTDILKSVNVITAGGGLLTCVADMAKYMSFHLNLGKVGNVQLVPENVMLWIRGHNVPFIAGDYRTATSDYLELSLSYGLCVYSGLYDGYYTVSHDGLLPPYESRMTLFPDLKIGIFTVTNGPGHLLYEHPNMREIHNDIFNILQRKLPMNRTITNVKTNIENSGMKRSSYHVSNIDVSMEQAVGTYGSPLNGDINLSLRNNSDGVPQLYWEYGQLGKVWMIKSSNSTFTTDKWDSDFWMMGWASGLNSMPSTVLNFLDLNTIEIFDNGAKSTDNFIRNLKLDEMPEIPYEVEQPNNDNCKSNGMDLTSRMYITITTGTLILLVTYI